MVSIKETGDVTGRMLSAIPPKFKTIDVKITLEPPDEIKIYDDG